MAFRHANQIKKHVIKHIFSKTTLFCIKVSSFSYPVIVYLGQIYDIFPQMEIRSRDISETTDYINSF